MKVPASTALIQCAHPAYAIPASVRQKVRDLAASPNLEVDGFTIARGKVIVHTKANGVERIEELAAG